MRPIALVTDELRGLTPDDEPLIAAFAARGYSAEAVRWDIAADWRGYAAAVIRTPWDYTQRFEAFSAWLDALEATGVALWNPSSVVRWNARKTYLIELAEQGLPVIPTAQVGADGLRAHVERWKEIVVKPEVGAAGSWMFRADDRSFRQVEDELARAGDRAFLVQPFDPAVAQGEWSLVYFDGVFSHAVFKVAASGSFLIHEEHGGSVFSGTASPALRAIGDRFANARGVLPYARVDLLGDDQDARLVELELIEPELFFRFAPEAADRFAEAVCSRLDTGSLTP